MKLVKCIACGSKALHEDGGYVVCTFCRSRFVPQASDVPQKETVIGLHSDILVLLQKCEDDPVNRHRYAALILDMDPTNQEARKYLS